MKASRRYVCAFRGRRDGYQLPAALQEANALTAFITDTYASTAVLGLSNLLPRRFVEKMHSRHYDQLSDDNVRCLWATAAMERLWGLAGRPPADIYARFDRRYSWAAAAIARREKADLFLYSPYAQEALSACYPHDPRKLLFQFHPHIATESRMMRDDWERFGDMLSAGLVLENHVGIDTNAREHSDQSWKWADHIVCASSFTRLSLIEAGADPERISVAPYGVDPAVLSADARRDPFFHALFVGSGVQRKGLHHLLLAWQRANLPSDSKLTLVCRVVEPAFLPLIAGTRGVKLICGVSRSQLERLYGSATLLAMPSLVEGFGQVYLEALSFGLPVLGTVQTGLPDLGNEADGIYICEAGNIDALAETLTKLACTLPDAPGINENARRCAGRFPWERFRARIRALL